MGSSDFFNESTSDGGFVEGLKGGSVRKHEYGFGIGHIKEQGSDNPPITHYNNFVREVDALLPDWMKAEDGK